MTDMSHKILQWIKCLLSNAKSPQCARSACCKMGCDASTTLHRRARDRHDLRGIGQREGIFRHEHAEAPATRQG